MKPKSIENQPWLILLSVPSLLYLVYWRGKKRRGKSSTSITKALRKILDSKIIIDIIIDILFKILCSANINKGSHNRLCLAH